MLVEKKVLGHLEKCYALCPIIYQGSPHFLVASELEKPCLLFDMEGNQRDTVWEKPGGVMSMVYVPGTNGAFLTTHKFYSFNDAGEAEISLVAPDGDGHWTIRTLVELPFVHRIDILEAGGARYLIACQLKSGHEYEDDWRFPGKVYTARLPEDLSQFGPDERIQLDILLDGLPRNHGYYRLTNGEGCLVAAENGVYRIAPPTHPGEAWTVSQISQDPASDAALIDLDGDGREELAVITPFHGEKVCIFREDAEGYTCTFTYDKALPFLHGFYAGPLCGAPALVVGHRAGDRDLLAFTWRDGCCRAQLLDHDVGPANVMVYQKDGQDILISANREIDEIAMYILDAEE